MTTSLLLLALALLLVAACGVFVAAEFSFVTVDRATIEREAAGGDRGAQGTLKALRTLSTHRATVGPPRPWRDVRVSFDRALRARAAGLGPDTEEHLVPLVLGADPEALADLRAAVLAPLSSVRPAVAEKLTETLRSWLLHHGRRDEVAAALFVHPQTVRYRMGQLRDLFGDSLEDPQTVLALTVALGV